MRQRTGFWAAAVMVLTLSPLQAAEGISVIPQPVSMQVNRGQFVLSADTVIVADAELQDKAGQLADALRPATGFPFTIQTAAAGNAIRLKLDASLERLGKEGYRLTVKPDGIAIDAPAKAGVFYGIQTLRQLLPEAIYAADKQSGVAWTVPCVEIEDYPRFQWRGMHLDVARYFMPAEFVKKYIDLLAMHKMNTFHWHLTEDQGWRIEIRKYPKLTEVGAWRDETIVGHAGRGGNQYDGIRHGGFYTQQQVREIVAYAKQRHVNVVPEIEMPGHSQAAIAAYPELGCTDQPLKVMTTWGVNENVFNVNEVTFTFLQDVLLEVMELFDSPFIHIGGDEVPKKQWKENAYAQAKMKELGLKNEEELQSWFIKRIDTFVTQHGRRIIGWDEILEGGLAPGATVMSWRGEAGGIAAAKSGHDVVMASNSHLYFDYYQADPKTEPLAIGGFLPLEKVYSYDPVPAVLSGQQAKHILGAQGQLWAEYIPNPKHAEYMAFPRASALAEVVWSPKQARNYDQFIERMMTHAQRLSRLDVNYCPLDKTGLLRPQIRRDKLGQVSIVCHPSSTEVFYTLDGSTPTETSQRYQQAFDYPQGGTVRAVAVWKGRSGPVSEAVFGPSKRGWTILAFSSHQAGEEAVNAIDDNPETLWHTAYGDTTPSHPHTLDIDLGKTCMLKGATYTPRSNGANGTVQECEFYTSQDGKSWTLAGKGSFGDIKQNMTEHRVLFASPVKAKYLRFVSIREINGGAWASAGEIGIISGD